MTEGPKLLIEWEPRGRGFLRSLSPAFSRSQRRLLVEVDRSPRALRPVLLSYCLHLAIVLAIASAPIKQAFQTPDFVSAVEFHPEHYEIVYVPQNSLPTMKDAGGAAQGSSGAAGGAALQTPEQTIHIARGNLVLPHVVDVPKLALPRTETPANLLVSSALAPSVPANAIQHERIMTVQAFAATSVVAPTPQIVRERLVVDPALEVVPVPPPVSTPARDTLAGSKLELPVPDVAKRTEAATLAAIRAGVPPPDIPVVNVGTMAPPAPKDSSVIVSSQPGAAIGKPSEQSPGAIAMSPTGAGRPGIGEGTGTGAAHGDSSGSTAQGGGSGATVTGYGPGDSAVHGGIAPGAGPGGSGAGMIGGAIPGVTISGGQVMLPSFGPTPSAKQNSPRSPKDQHAMRPVTVVATATAGGAVSAHGLLKGPKVYTIYIDTTAGLAFLQFAERTAGPIGRELTAPEPILSMVPAHLRSARVLLAGVMDTNGSLKNLRIVEAVSEDMARSAIAAVQNWHFRPAYAGANPVEVDAIFGLNVDTR
jgi:hypothetical protein